MTTSASLRKWKILAMGVLACLVGWVFTPILNFPFAELDVQQQVVDNPWIRGLTGQNLSKIFTSPCITSYYPVRTLTYAVDYEFWGLNPMGFKLTNGLFHLANVLLVFWLAMRMLCWPASAAFNLTKGDVFAAALAAAVFAIHPVVVEPVTWVPGREELLMTLGALACVHFHLAARQLDIEDGKLGRSVACRLAAALCCAAACLSNAVAAVVPLLATAWDVLTITRPTLGKLVRSTAALWVIGIATIAAKTACEYLRDYQPAETGLTSNLMQVVSLYGMNLKTLAWPTNLGVYPPGIAPQHLDEPMVVLGGIAVFATLILLWKIRKQTPAVFGLMWFAVTLAPTSQILPHHIQRADRFLYLPLVGLVIAGAFGLRLALNNTSKRIGTALVAAAVLAILALGIRSTHQIQTWQSVLAMWQNSVRINPTGFVANCALAENLAIRERYAEAIECYRTVHRTNPGIPRVSNGLARLLVLCPDENLRDYELAIRLAEEAVGRDPKYFSTPLLVRTHYGKHLAENGRFRQALQQFSLAVDLYPDYLPALLQIAALRATCSDPQLRNPEEAVRLAEHACRVAGEPTLDQLHILAGAYASAGQFDSAIQVVRRCLALVDPANEPAAAEKLRTQLERYRSRMP